MITEQAVIEKAVGILNNGGVILYPTDTVWGIGCDPTNESAVQRVFDLKQRPTNKSMILLVDSPDRIQPYVRSLSPFAKRLLTESETPQTVILPEAFGFAPSVLPMQKTVAVRCPKHEFCLRLLRAFGKPLVSTSANLSGEPSARTYRELSERLMQGVDYVIPEQYEAGSTQKASRIILLNPDESLTVLRE